LDFLTQFMLLQLPMLFFLVGKIGRLLDLFYVYSLLNFKLLFLCLQIAFRAHEMSVSLLQFRKVLRQRLVFVFLDGESARGVLQVSRHFFLLM